MLLKIVFPFYLPVTIEDDRMLDSSDIQMVLCQSCIDPYHYTTSTTTIGQTTYCSF